MSYYKAISKANQNRSKGSLLEYGYYTPQNYYRQGITLSENRSHFDKYVYLIMKILMCSNNVNSIYYKINPSPNPEKRVRFEE